MSEAKLLKENGSQKAGQLLIQHERLLEKECNERVEAIAYLVRNLGNGWEAEIENETAFLINVNKGRDALRNTLTSLDKVPKKSKKGVFKHQISALFLRDCFQHLISDPAKHERLLLITGTITEDETRVLSKIVKVKMEGQSAVYVKANEPDAHEKIVSLAERHGHRLLAMFHSHMSYGENATQPSSTDIKNQERLVKLGCDAIGGIFSLDGYIRFFSTWKDFEMDVYGKGMDKIRDEPKEKVFKILDAKQEK